MIGKAYGAFFLLPSRLAGYLLLAATFVDWRTGLSGVVGAWGAAWACRAFQIPRRSDHLDVVNGALLGLLIGSSYAWNLRSLLFLLAAGPLAVLGARALEASLSVWNLPLLCAPFAVLGVLMLSAGRALYLPGAPANYLSTLSGSEPLELFLKSLGGVYLSPYVLSGVLVFLALAVSCRYLCAYSVLGFVASEALMLALGVSDPLTRMVGGTGAVLCALIVGGLHVAPGWSSMLLGAGSGGAASMLYLALVAPMAQLGFPPLAWPFMLITWGALLAFSHHTGVEWLSAPALPSQSAEKQALARARGVDARSLALNLPFEGSWDVYQSFDGPHTHQGPWRYALDFIRCEGEKSYAEEGLRLTDYHCFALSVLSPVKGTVVACQSEIPDNRPGEVNVQQRFGNYVLIDVGQSRCVLLAHLKQGSLRVSPGQAVEVGTLLGSCGNSGRSPQPHLHIHVQKGRELGSPTVPFHLSGAVVRGEFTLSSVPETGDSVSAPDYSGRMAEALRLPVGRKIIFSVEKEGQNRLRTFRVTIDLLGQFWLEGEKGSRMALYQDERLFTCFDRNEVPDEALDALALALGVTPLSAEAQVWRDTPPSRLLPGSFWAGRVCGYGRYEREFSEDGSWYQRGSHALRQGGPVVSRTCVRFTLERGIRELTLYRGEELRLKAKVVGVGMCADAGAPGWEVGIAETGRMGAGA